MAFGTTTAGAVSPATRSSRMDGFSEAGALIGTSLALPPSIASFGRGGNGLLLRGLGVVVVEDPEGVLLPLERAAVRGPGLLAVPQVEDEVRADAGVGVEVVVAPGAVAADPGVDDLDPVLTVQAFERLGREVRRLEAAEPLDAREEPVGNAERAVPLREIDRQPVRDQEEALGDDARHEDVEVDVGCR